MKKILLSITFLLACIAAGAKGFKIATGEPLHSNQQELAVKGRMGFLLKQKLKFGDYHTVMVKRSAIRKWTGITGFPGLIWTEHMEGRQSIHYRLTNSKDTSDVVAVSNVTANDLLIGTSREQRRIPGSILSVYKRTEVSGNNYSVSIVTRKGDAPWELFLDNNDAQLRRKEPAGYIARDERYYTIVPVWQVEGKNGKIANLPFGATGFEIINEENEVMAAVSLIDNGKIYIGPGSDEEKFLLSNACAALLLQTNIMD